jgi:DNA-binding response OmpR family regulator
MSTPPSPPAEPEFTGEPGPPLVLIVEDEQPIAEALAYIVQEAGYRALIAPHGKAGLAFALAQRPALIFSDLMMPQMDGRELIRQLQAALDSAAPPVVLMTAADVRFARDAGAAEVLKKPFDIAAIEALLSHFLDPQ